MPAIPLTDKFIPAFNFQEVLVDKTTGFPLAKGIVTFYQDNQRTVLKDIFQLTGIPGAYTVTQLPNPLTLSSVGTFQDNSGNDIVPYFYPYDDVGQPEYYYVTVYSSLDGIIPAVLQFTREHVPYLPEQQNEDIAGITNYIPDGQFLIHNDVLNITNDVALLPGQITEDITIIAPNGWQYEKTSGSASTDTLIFERLPIGDLPQGNPRYACIISCDFPDGNDTYKYLSINFPDVNKFANDNNYTFSFSAKSLSGVAAVGILTRKNYGVGGSPQEITVLGTKPITATSTMYNISFSLGSNIGKNLGPNNDDYFSLIIALPPNVAFSMEFTDFILSDGINSFSTFPVTTNSEFSYETISGSLPVPNYQGMNYYLPRVLTAAGEIYDDSYIGEIYGSAKVDLEITELLCNGASYDTDKYDSRTNIPYRRLANKWKSVSGNGVCIYGNGTGFYLICSLPPSSAVITATGHVTYNLTFADGAGPLATGFTFTDLGGSHNVWHITTIAGSLIPDGSYFTFKDNNGVFYYVWMKGSDTSVDPKPVGITRRIICNYLPADTDQQVALKVMIAINNKYVQLPNYRGYFLRGWADGSANDPDRASRSARGDGVVGDNVGTLQSISSGVAEISSTFNVSVGGTSLVTSVAGVVESNFPPYAFANEAAPINAYVQWVVRY